MSRGPRIVVVQSEGPRGIEAGRLGVGAVPFRREGELRLGVVTKLLLDMPALRDEKAPCAPAAAPPLLRPDVPSRFAADPPDAVDYTSDFVPPRGTVEVHVVGHAQAGAPSSRRMVRVAVVGHDGVRVVEASRALSSPVPVASFPLAAAAFGAQAAALGPRPAPALPEDGLYSLGPEGGAGATCARDLSAPRGALRDDATLLIEGTRPDGVAQLALPGLRPRVEVDFVGANARVPMHLETIWIDLDAGQGALVFRGECAIPQQTVDAVHRIVVSLESRDAERGRDQRLADIQRGDVGWAQVREMGATPPPVDPDDPVIDAATVETWGAVAPEPRVPLPRFAAIAAELAEDPRARGRVLARHEISERTWMIEERAWLERMAVLAMKGDPATAAIYGQLFAEAQDALGTETEARVSLDDFAAALVALDRAHDPTEALEQLGWTLPFYARVERRWTRAAEDEPAIAERLRRKVAELEAAAGPA